MNRFWLAGGVTSFALVAVAMLVQGLLSVGFNGKPEAIVAKPLVITLIFVIISLGLLLVVKDDGPSWDIGNLWWRALILSIPITLVISAVLYLTNSRN
jgi:hypothetical protein